MLTASSFCFTFRHQMTPRASNLDLCDNIKRDADAICFFLPSLSGIFGSDNFFRLVFSYGCEMGLDADFVCPVGFSMRRVELGSTDDQMPWIDTHWCIAEVTHAHTPRNIIAVPKYPGGHMCLLDSNGSDYKRAVST